MNIIKIFFLSLAAATILFSAVVTASDEDNALQISGDSCMTSQCHGDLKERKYVHGPIAAGQCEACHGESPKHADSPQKHKFKHIESTSEICYACHEQFQTKEFMHSPVSEGECTSCHDPHGSSHKLQLVAGGGELCFSCHDEDIVAGKYVHGPAAVGGCVACHDPHTADYAKNLRADGPELCFNCHTEKENAINGADYVHTPVSEDCTGCHDPHSAPEKFMLFSRVPSLCLECHDEQKKQISQASVKHGALETDRSCLNCHDVHKSNISKNLVDDPMDLCMSCHDRVYENENGPDITNMKKLLAENMDHHGPIKQKDCSGCHNPHGSENFRILRNPYPPSFYMPFAENNYNLCFSCHEKTLVLEPETTKLTNFRNGSQNLHFTHVNKPGKGRTCRACHETHGSNYPKHIRESVPFGSWDLPVEFQKTETGGSCTTGCHQEKQYDRKNRVING
jgi:DmsE family decaheme c-type cytochrome